MLVFMKIKNEDQQEHPKLLKTSDGHYEIIGGTDEDFQAALQWAEYWGHEIVSKPKCQGRKIIPPLFKYQRPTIFVGLKSRAKF